jgi:hypothetical protein
MIAECLLQTNRNILFRMFVTNNKKNEPKDFMRVCMCVCVRACIADCALARAPPLKINRLQYECRRIGKTQMAIATATLCKGGEGYFSFFSLFIGSNNIL